MRARGASALIAALAAAGLLALAPPAHASNRSARSVRVARGTPALSVARGARDVLRLGRRTLWTAAPRERIVSETVWSRTRDGVAFATRDAMGALSLVVVLVEGDTNEHVMRWALPRLDARVRRPIITWLGAQRVSVGASELRPTIVASWRVESI